MVAGGALKAVARGFWGRPWLRRLTLTLVAGSTALGGLAWTLRQPHFAAWVARAIDRRLREETGLSFAAESIQVHPWEGRVVFHGLALGGDLLRVGRAELTVQPLSLLGPRPHVRQILVEDPTVILDAERLRNFKPKPRTRDEKPLDFLLDRLDVRGGFILVREPAWGLESASATFEVNGTGTGPGSLRTQLKAPAVSVGRGEHRLAGSLEAALEVTPAALVLRDARLGLGKSHLSPGARLDRAASHMEGTLAGHLVLDELGCLGPKPVTDLGGVLDLDGTASLGSGTFRWTATLKGSALKPGPASIAPGQLKASLQGDASTVRLASFRWESPQGILSAEGFRKAGRETRLSFTTEGLGLAPVAALARVPSLSELVLSSRGEVAWPENAQGRPQLDRLKATVQGQFARGGAPAGSFDVKADNGALSVDALRLLMPDLDVQGRGRARVGPRGLLDLAVEGHTRTEVGKVASALFAWNIGLGQDRLLPDGRKERILVALPMSGHVQAEATLGWTPAGGFTLAGRGTVMEPGWYQARADRLEAQVDIRQDQLRIREIDLRKGEGRGWGDIWLTWADLPPGSDDMDMCFRAEALPIEEGLKAADAEKVQIKGTGSGWTRLHGPFTRIVLDAEGVAENADVYGVHIPAFKGEMSLDVDAYQMTVKRFQVAERIADLGPLDESPTGHLALEGRMFMDIGAERWDVQVHGPLDSGPLGLPGPRFQATLDARLDGPWTSRLGPKDLPNGNVTLKQGRLFLGEQSLEGLEASLDVHRGELRGELGYAGQPEKALGLVGFQQGDSLLLAARLKLAPETAPTDITAQMLTRDLVQDLALGLEARGVWAAEGLAWKGSLDAFTATFQGFGLQMSGPGSLRGDAQGLDLALPLEGRSPGNPASTAHVALSGRIPFSRTVPVDLRAKGSADLQDVKGVLDHLLELDPYSLLADLKVEGRAELDMGLVGTFTRPGLDGTVGLRSGRLQILTYPQGIEDLDLTLHLQDRDILVKEGDPLTGTLAQGALRSWGRATWQTGGLKEYDFRALLGDFQFRDIPEGFELQGSLDATLRGSDSDGGTLKGRLTGQSALYRADIRLTDILLTRSMGAAGLLAGLDPDDPLSRIALDLDLQLRDPWQFDTNLLKIQGRLASPFKVLGTLARPGLRGKMDFLPGGRLTNLLPAGDVIIEGGSINFTDPESLNPIISLQGRVDVPPYAVNLAINGSLDQLNVVPTSTPSLRQDEVVAILIDPTVAQDIGATAVSNSQSALTHGLASTSTGLLTSLALANFQEGLRKTFNLDRVNVALRTGTAGTYETSITAGKSFELFGRRVPIVGTYRRSGDWASVSGQVEWRFGNFVFQFGASSDEPGKVNPTGEIRYTWSLR